MEIHERLRAGDKVKVRQDDRSLLRSVVLQLKAGSAIWAKA